MLLYPLLLGLAIGFAISFESYHEAAHWVPFKCPLHALTGWLCPTCGMTRAFLALFRGQIIASIELHPMAIIATVLSFLFWVSLLFAKNTVSLLYELYHTKRLIFIRSSHWLIVLYTVWGFSRNF
ncbi:MAG: DUF2752 domain-containing protein [Bdellovibrionales bacterium]|nr:DUF2752 domain-containing protein [Bdellovibrionales bacterium]